MSDNRKQGDDPSDLVLARAVKQLNREIMPERDLWAGIERRISEFPQKTPVRWRNDWMPYGVAASLLIAVASFSLNFYKQDSSSGFSSSATDFEMPVDAIGDRYRMVTSPLSREFSETNKSLDPVTLDELYRNLAIIEQSRKDIEAQIRQNPDNQKLVEMLIWIHQQEVDLLKQDYTVPMKTL